MNRPEGIYQCSGCGRVYPEYVNGCVEEHSYPRRVVCVIPEVDTAPVGQ